MLLQNTWLQRKGWRDVVENEAGLVKKKKKRSYSLALNATLRCCTLILHSARSQKDFGQCFIKIELATM